MNKKIIGVILILIAIASSIVLYSFKLKLEAALDFQIQQYGESCPTDPKICPHSQLANLDSLSSILFSIFGFLALAGIYLLFDKSEMKTRENQLAIVKTLENIKKEDESNDKFGILLKALNDDEKKVISIIKEQDGISQNTLVLRSDMSKAKISTILSDFENKNLIKKVKKGKTNSIYLKTSF